MAGMKETSSMELRKIFLSEGVIMNRALHVIIFSFLFICLCSCSAESPEKHSQDIGNYNIVETVYTDNIDATNQKVSISYPQISNLKSIDVEQLINNSIESLALEILEQFTTLDEMEVKVTYSITHSTSDILSLYFVAESFHPAQAYPLIRISAATFSIESGDIIKLTKIIDINDDFINSFFNNYHLYSKYNSVEEEHVVNEYVSGILSRESFLISDEGLNSEIHGFLTDDSLIISIAVPHSIGSYVLYEAKYSKIKDFLNMDMN